MEATNGWKERLKTALENDESIKIIFQYPSSTRAIIKRGKVVKIYVDSFDFNEIYDGHASYSYLYIVEIKPVREGK